MGSESAFRPTFLGALQARLVRRLILLVGKGLFRFRVEVDGLEHLPAGEPLIVAAAPHRSWIDSFLLVMALPPLPRLYFVAVAENTLNQWWKRLVLRLAGGMVPVSRGSVLNREGLQTSLAILAGGNRLGIYPEGWDSTDASPTEVDPLQRGVAFLSEHSGLRTLPVGLAGTHDLWRGKTLRVRVAPPLERLKPDADRQESVAYVNRLREVLQTTLPPQPPEPAGGKKPWRWLTRML